MAASPSEEPEKKCYSTKKKLRPMMTYDENRSAFENAKRESIGGHKTK